MRRFFWRSSRNLHGGSLLQRRSGLPRQHQLVADAADRFDADGLGAQLELLAQRADMDIDGPLAADIVEAPDDIHEVVAGDDHARPLDQIQQNFEFLRPQRHLLAREHDLVAVGINGQLPGRNDLVLRVRGIRQAAARSPEHGGYPGQQLRHAERLGDVIVRAVLESLHDLFLGVACGQDDDRRPDAALPQLAQHLEAVHARQHDIEHDQVEAPLQSRLQPVRPVLRYGYFIPFLRQVIRQKPG
ncbi:hypothetical protein BN871_EW_00120 [Paenibacillus sp. P22]|nr:hypothetical protein BN871_EW_00120 [Paenibacillus sp. P22]